MGDTLEWIFQELLLQNIIFFIIGGIIFSISLFLKKFGIIYQCFHKVERGTSKHGGEVVADVLKAHKIEYIFTLVGGHISPILVAAEKIGIRIIDTRHEVTAVFAADAVARLSGTIGVAAVTAGPGLTNTVTAVKNAQMAESPILLIGGAAPSLLKGRGALQDIDQMCLFKPLCKYTARVTRIRDIVPIIKEAISVAQSGTPGPVFVEFPIDTLYPFHMIEKEMISSSTKPGKKSIQQRIVNWYLNNHICNLFAGAFEERDMTPLPVSQPRASQEQIQNCAEIVKRAKKPVMILGSQAMLPPVAANDVKEKLEQLAIPCFLGGMARGLLGKDSPIHIRQNRRAALKEADVILLIGSVCDFRLGYGKVLPRKAKVIAVNRSKSQLYKNSDMFWRPTIAVQADPASLIVSLADELGKGYSAPQNWTEQLKEGDSTKEIQNRQKADEPTNMHLNPLKVLYSLEDILPENSILVADGGDFVGSAAYIVRPRSALKWLDPGAFGTLGVGGGFALGAKLVRPDCEVWVIYGDGSLGYSVAEFDTFTRHKVPILALVGNDACWSQISRDQVTWFGSNVACGLEFTDYHKVAVGYGGHGLLLGRDNDITATLKNAQHLCKETGKPVLVNALIGKTNFREGSISV